MTKKVKIVWTAQAKDNLRKIYQFLHRNSKSREVAKRVIHRIRNRVDNLTIISAESGTIQEELSQNNQIYRYLIVGNYKIIYRVKDGSIVIVNTVFDTRQDPANLKVKE